MTQQEFDLNKKLEEQWKSRLNYLSIENNILKVYLIV